MVVSYSTPFYYEMQNQLYYKSISATTQRSNIFITSLKYIKVAAFLCDAYETINSMNNTIASHQLIYYVNEHVKYAHLTLAAILTY